MKKFFIIACLMMVSTGCLAVAKPKIFVEEHKPGIFVFEINKNAKIEPYVSEELVSNREVFEKTKAKLVVNAGFFDPNNGKTISYVIRNGRVVADPSENESLMKNPDLLKNMAKISNRTELRVLNCKGKTEYDIANHFFEYENGCKVVHSIQGGPQLLPSPALEEEFFVVKQARRVIRESASVLHKTARTAVGIKKDKLYIIIATTKSPMTIKGLSELCTELEFEKAMAFDGGGSTSIDFENLSIISDKDETARKLKSFILVF